VFCGNGDGVALTGYGNHCTEKIDEGDKSDFYAGKVMQARYFADVTLPLLQARSEMCIRPARDVIDMPEAAF
jgi:hypothetical protein